MGRIHLRKRISGECMVCFELYTKYTRDTLSKKAHLTNTVPSAPYQHHPLATTPLRRRAILRQAQPIAIYLWFIATPARPVATELQFIATAAARLPQLAKIKSQRVTARCDRPWQLGCRRYQ
jgi:hypothetical protein